jgi:chromosome segregation ATPase
VAERLEAEDAVRSAEDLRKQMREKRAEVSELRRAALALKERLQDAEFKLQESRALCVQRDRAAHEISAQFHRKERQVRSLLRNEHGRLVRLITHFVHAVNGVSARVDGLRDEVRAATRGDSDARAPTQSDSEARAGTGGDSDAAGFDQFLPRRPG